MKTLTWWLAVVVVVCCGRSAFAEEEVEHPSLTVGSRAPEINVEHWVNRETNQLVPVTKFEPGKIYVVEFWATWCGPCVSSMPHLAELQTKHREQGVRIISISDEEVETVTEFLKRPVPEAEGAKEQSYGDLTSAYSVATDPDRSVYQEYMEASGQRGIPTAFLVGKTGEIEWFGHPMSMDEPLANVIDGTWDRAKFLAEHSKWHAWSWFNTRLAKLVKTGNYDAARALLAKQKPRLAERFSDEPRLLEQLKGLDAELERDILMAPAMAAYQARDYEKCAAELETVVAQANPSQLPLANNLAFFVAMKLKRHDHAKQILTATMDAVEATDILHVNILNGMCWKVYTEASGADSALPAPLIAVALAGAERAVKLAPEDNPILDTLAHLLAISGDLNRAVELETIAWERETHPETKNDFRRALEALKQKQATATDSPSKP